MLCVYQRVPYGALVLINILAIYIRKFRFWSAVLSLCCVVLSLALSAWHVMIEWGLIVEKCAVIQANTPEQMLQTLTKNAPTCAEPILLLFGISMAEWNFLLSCLLLIVSTLGVKYGKR